MYERLHTAGFASEAPRSLHGSWTFNVQGTCPVTTQKALQSLAHDSSETVAYWRVINKNGGLIARYPGGVEGHAARLREEGFTIDTKGKSPQVKNFRESLVRFR